MLQAKEGLFSFLNSLLIGVLNDALAGCSIGNSMPFHDWSAVSLDS
jgi:hypothetical protein